ncbi:peptidase M23 [Plantactinospora sp. GCM10030261]|uniref:peptidase M23 n=1 Tax=Plantactinospora sp. GCM10030261 TaxID=3273420 RepID=UPI0036098E51
MRNDDPLHDAEWRSPGDRTLPYARRTPTAPATRHRPVRSRLAGLVDRPNRRRAAVVGLVGCLGLATFVQASAERAARGGIEPVSFGPAATPSATGDPGPASGGPAASAGEPATSAGEPTTSAGGPTTATGEPSATAPATGDPTSTASPDPDIPAGSTGPTKIEHTIDPGPVAGLTVAQMNNAKAIVRTGRDMGMPRRALIIAVATAMQESNLYNYASGVLPESQNYPHQAIGWDHDSVGLFQQRPSTGWGPVRRLMQPAYATTQFLVALRQVPGWHRLALTDAAQAVQVSAFPYAYARHEARATEVVDAIVPGWA